MPLKEINVLFIWDTGAELKNHLTKVFKKESNIHLIFPKSFSKKNILKLCKEADIIVGWRPSKEQLTAAIKLKLYINPGTGIKHHINNFKEINKTRKVVLVNGHGHAYSTAQHTVAMLMALLNRIIPNHILMKEGKWNTSDDKDILSASVQLRDRKIGLLGYGAINKYVHRFLSGFENEFHILKKNPERGVPVLKYNDLKINFYLPEDLNKFLKTIDILIIAIPHTSMTEGLIGKKELKLLGKDSLLVNVARGLIVDEESLYDALKKSFIGGAALDVWYNYQPEKDKNGREFPFKFPFHMLKNIVMSPHRAASPFDDIKRWDEVIENIRKVAKGKKDYLNIVDLNEEY